MDNQENKKRVIIIGGGAGGLYAGWRLSQKGFKISIIERKSEFPDLG